MEPINETIARQLLERYLLGETSLIEEKQLSQYFCNAQLPHDLLPYRALFRFFRHEAAVMPPERAVVPSVVAVMPPESAVVPSEAEVMPPERAVVPSVVAVMPPERVVVPSEAAVMPPERAVVPSVVAVMPPEKTVRSSRNVVFRRLAPVAAVAAAALILFFSLNRPVQSDFVCYIDGERIQNQEEVLLLAQQQWAEMTERIERASAMVDKLERITNYTETINKYIK